MQCAVVGAIFSSRSYSTQTRKRTPLSKCILHVRVAVSKTNAATRTTERDGRRKGSLSEDLGLSADRIVWENRGGIPGRTISSRARSLKAGFEAQHACIRIGAAFLNQLATTKRTSRPSVSQPLGYRVPVAGARCYYRRGTCASARARARARARTRASYRLELWNAFCRRTETRRRVFPSY